MSWRWRPPAAESLRQGGGLRPGVGRSEARQGKEKGKGSDSLPGLCPHQRRCDDHWRPLMLAGLALSPEPVAPGALALVNHLGRGGGAHCPRARQQRPASVDQRIQPPTEVASAGELTTHRHQSPTNSFRNLPALERCTSFP